MSTHSNTAHAEVKATINASEFVSYVHVGAPTGTVAADTKVTATPAKPQPIIVTANA